MKQCLTNTAILFMISLTLLGRAGGNKPKLKEGAEQTDGQCPHSEPPILRYNPRLYARNRIELVLLIVGWAAGVIGLTTKDTRRGKAMLRLAMDEADVSQLLELTGITGYAICDKAFSG